MDIVTSMVFMVGRSCGCVCVCVCVRACARACVVGSRAFCAQAMGYGNKRRLSLCVVDVAWAMARFTHIYEQGLVVTLARIDVAGVDLAQQNNT